MFRIVFLKGSLLLLLTIISSCSRRNESAGVPYYNTPDFTPQFFSLASEADQKINHSIAPFAFTDQHGKKITEKDIEGKIHIANFIFTSCGSICPLMTRHLKLVQSAFLDNPDVVILSYSVTPWIDSIGRLKEFADNQGIHSNNWHLLTGDKGEIYTLARKSYFAEEDLGFTRDSTEFLHTEHIILVDKKKRIRGIYNGTLQLDIEQMIKDINCLLKSGPQK
ncbi:MULTISPECIES: SCO family protein [unclassified Chitinophaga]|uniref:SCO family protein n=1 Tax=unclassified Chitinophaga TaxID=2619133 RepID=UPI0009C6A9C1|nr:MULTISPECIES: SCO family protein [unclassified Chitinophaga]OMP80884.1 SCO family protein [[Flexibacter] sp. ATCC 35208]WPV69972.1 SCO family protein [Chitinophaga sp. LS1]